MTSRVYRRALLALLGLAPSGILGAQVAGLPVRNAGIGTGIGVAVDAGFPNGAAGKGWAVGATGMVGLGPFGVTASVSHWKPKGLESLNAVGATGNLKILGGPLIPLSVTLQAGAGYSKVTQQGIEAPVTTKTVHVPVGIGVALTIPNPVFSIKPWIAPRLDVVRVTIKSDTPAETSTDKRFAISGGVDLGFLSGFSVRVMYDRTTTGDEGATRHPSILSIGVGLKVGL
jgi:hypothetical protein